MDECVFFVCITGLSLQPSFSLLLIFTLVLIEVAKTSGKMIRLAAISKIPICLSFQKEKTCLFGKHLLTANYPLTCYLLWTLLLKWYIHLASLLLWWFAPDCLLRVLLTKHINLASICRRELLSTYSKPEGWWGPSFPLTKKGNTCSFFITLFLVLLQFLILFYNFSSLFLSSGVDTLILTAYNPSLMFL